MKYSVSKLFVLSILLVVFSCNKKGEGEAPDYDRKALLVNIGNELILPSYEEMNKKADALDEAVIKFSEQPASNTLSDLRNKFKEAYLAWQTCSPYEFGPAEQIALRDNLNIFPTTVNTINNNIKNGSYNLSAANNYSAKGFPAIDYLLYGIGSNEAEVIGMFTTDEYASERKAYLKALSAEIKEKISFVYNEWSSSGGNYLNEFTENTGTDMGSSLGLLVNQLNFDYETIKNYKIGIPVGVKNLGDPMPEKCEAYYSGFSLELANKSLSTIENIFLGRGKNDLDGTGLDDYLEFLEAKWNEQLLSQRIKQQFSTIHASMALIPDPLSESVNTHTDLVHKAYTDIQRMVVFTKTDMASAMGILITYQDNDGD